MKTILQQQQSQAWLTSLARESISGHFNFNSTHGSSERESSHQPQPPENLKPLLSKTIAVFVTLRRNGQLRGCIGHIEARESLQQAIISMAKAAAFSDHRFPPVGKDELATIDIELSILTPMTKITTDPLEFIILGTHGVYLSYQGASSVFLPEVPLEVGWDRQTYLRELCYKAGIAENSWKMADLYSFESIKIIEK